MKINLISYAKLAGAARGFRVVRRQGREEKEDGVCAVLGILY